MSVTKFFFFSEAHRDAIQGALPALNKGVPSKSIDQEVFRINGNFFMQRVYIPNGVHIKGVSHDRVLKKVFIMIAIKKENFSKLFYPHGKNVSQ